MRLRHTATDREGHTPAGSAALRAIAPCEFPTTSSELGVRRALDGADRVVTSAFTGVECARALTRARLQSRILPVEELAALQLLQRSEFTWDVHAITDSVLLRARSPMPGDPVRTFDALHVATMTVLRESVGPLAVLSLDDRVRVCAVALGFVVLPEAHV